MDSVVSLHGTQLSPPTRRHARLPPAPSPRIPAPNPMNYRHAFHAGNHAAVLKHVALLAPFDAPVAQPSACFPLDTHAGPGLDQADWSSGPRTGAGEHRHGRVFGPRPGGPADRT